MSEFPLAKTYRVTPGVRISNAVIAVLLRFGLPLPRMILLTVPGRKSGKPRTLPVVVLEHDGHRWLGSPFGNVNWVQNVRAAGVATLRRGPRSEQVAARELSAAEAGRVWQQLLPTAPGFIRAYFDVTPNSSLESFEAEAPRHPLFELTPIDARVLITAQ